VSYSHQATSLGNKLVPWMTDTILHVQTHPRDYVLLWKQLQFSILNSTKTTIQPDAMTLDTKSFTTQNMEIIWLIKFCMNTTVVSLR